MPVGKGEQWKCASLGGRVGILGQNGEEDFLCPEKLDTRVFDSCKALETPKNPRKRPNRADEYPERQLGGEKARTSRVMCPFRAPKTPGD